MEDADPSLPGPDQQRSPALPSNWTVAIDVRLENVAGDSLHPTVIDRISQVLRGRGPVVKVALDKIVVAFGVEAADAAQADACGLELMAEVLRALDWPLTSITQVRVASNATLALETSYFPDYVGLGEVAELLGVSKQRVYQLAARPGFPKPILRLKATPIWRDVDIREFARNRRAPGRPRSTALRQVAP